MQHKPLDTRRSLYRRRLAAGIAALGLVAASLGCIVPGTVPTEQATPTALPTEIGGGVSATPLPSDTPVNTPTPRPTKTPRPTETTTPTNTPTYTLTPIPTATFTASPTPLTTPTSTISATLAALTTTVICGYDSSLVKDVTIPAGTSIGRGSAFTKSWKIRNSGCHNWTDGTELVFVGGDIMSGPGSISIGHLKGDNTEVVSIDLVAPSTKGNYVGQWQLRTPDNVLFGEVFYVRIRAV